MTPAVTQRIARTGCEGTLITSVPQDTVEQEPSAVKTCLRRYLADAVYYRTEVLSFHPMEGDSIG